MSEARRSSATARRLVLGAVLLALAGGVFALRYPRFVDLEPRIDQAHCTRWLQDLRRADHFWPKNEAGRISLAALNQDRVSALHHLGRRVFNQGIRAFNLVSLGVFWAGCLLLGDSYRAHNVLSLLASSGTIVLAGLFPLLCRRHSEDPLRPPVDDMIWGIGAALACATSFYLDLFSPWGWHNLGAFFTLLAAGVTARLLAPGRNGSTLSIILSVILVDALALYSHYATLFFLPAATCLALLASESISVRARLARLALYMVAVALVIAPGAAAVLFVTSENASSYMLMPNGWLAYLSGACGRAVGWFSSLARMFSAPGLAAGLAGLLWLGRRRGVWIPAAIVGAHFVSWTLLPGFSGTPDSPTWLRTCVYVLPLLGIGIAFCALVSAKAALSALVISGGSAPSRAVIAGAVLGLASVIIHVTIQLSCVLDERRAASRVPEFHEEYLKGQGTLRPMVDEIEQTVPARTALLAENYPLQDLLVILSDRTDRGAMLLPPLDVMYDRFAEGYLVEYLRIRRTRLEPDARVFVVSRVGPSLEAPVVKTRSVLGQGGLDWGKVGDLSRVGEWDTGSHVYGRVSLYRVLRTDAPLAADSGP